MKKQTTTQTRKDTWNGMNWIRQEKRLAIYLRDGMACAYCGATVETGNSLTLDHVRPVSKGGSNDATNLVTCCARCNSSRGNRSVSTFAAAVAGYLNHGAKAEDIIAHIRRTVRRTLKMAEAKAMIARRNTQMGDGR